MMKMMILSCLLVTLSVCSPLTQQDTQLLSYTKRCSLVCDPYQDLIPCYGACTCMPRRLGCPNIDDEATKKEDTLIPSQPKGCTLACAHNLRPCYAACTCTPLIVRCPITNTYKTEGMKANQAALDEYRLGWATGDTDIIFGVVTDTFNFTWVPDNDVVSKARFPSFLSDFITLSESDGRAKFFQTYDNIIQKQVGDTLYEAADWIVAGYDRGSYLNAAKEGKVIWDIATT
eukprot:GFUD01004882.1.p1 GENE.GFUD01004882.1~~GFUD01004882.1.p1  ORF type:complete len:231 (+),score=59.34 GFUD01004882.1:92-784(+)